MNDILNEKNKFRKDKFNNLKIINVNKMQIKNINKKDLNKRLNKIFCEMKKEINLSYEDVKNNEDIKKYEILYQDNNILKKENLKIKNEINKLTQNKNDLNKELSLLKNKYEEIKNKSSTNKYNDIEIIELKKINENLNKKLEEIMKSKNDNSQNKYKYKYELMIEEMNKKNSEINKLNQAIEELNKKNKMLINNLDETTGTVRLYVTRNGVRYETNYITLSESTDWRGEIFISVGSISLEKEGNSLKAVIRESGYDYSLEEDGYRWEIDVDKILHPMLVNGVVLMLEKIDDDDAEDLNIGESRFLISDDNNIYFKINNGVYKALLDIYDGEEQLDFGDNNYLVKDDKIYFKINDVIYVSQDSSKSEFIAVNYRKSNLNLKKIVTGTDSSTDSFKFNISVTSSDNEDVWFSVQDENGTTIYDIVTTNTSKEGDQEEKKLIVPTNPDPENPSNTVIVSIETLTSGVNAGKKVIKYTYKGEPYEVEYLREEISGDNTIYYYYTGYYYFSSGTTVTVELKDGWNLRFTNLPVGSEYTFEEIEILVKNL